MNAYREDPRMQFSTDHEVIHGTTGSGKTRTVRKLLAEDAATQLKPEVSDVRDALALLLDAARSFHAAVDSTAPHDTDLMEPGVRAALEEIRQALAAVLSQHGDRDLVGLEVLEDSLGPLGGPPVQIQAAASDGGTS